MAERETDNSQQTRLQESVKQLNSDAIQESDNVNHDSTLIDESSDKHEESNDIQKESNNVQQVTENQEMINEFASVWVKVEVEEERESNMFEWELESRNLGDVNNLPIAIPLEVPLTIKRKRLLYSDPITINPSPLSEEVFRNSPQQSSLTIVAEKLLYAAPASSTLSDAVELPVPLPAQSIVTEILLGAAPASSTLSDAVELSVPSPAHSPFTNKKKRKSTKILKCDRCDYTTAYKNCLKLHILGHAQSKPFSCSDCEYTTKYPTALQRHIVIKHRVSDEVTTDQSVQNHKCEICDYTTFYKSNLKAHRRKHLEKSFKCPVPDCSYETAYRHNLNKHSKKHNENVFYRCDKCPFMTRFEGHITRHLAKIHNVLTEGMNKCDFCDFSTKIRWRLNIHKQRSRQENVLKCSFCDFETYYMCESKIHKVSHYNEIYCKKSGQNRLDNDETQIEPYNEEIEDKNCVGDEKEPKYTLDPNCLDWNSIQVLESDDKERPFQCHMCSYTAKYKASVQRHFQRHHTGSQNRPYKCINCDFSTKTKDQIALHNKRSKTDTAMLCDQCDFTTKFKCQFVMHQKCHYDHKCPKCSYSCRHKHELHKHYTMVHLGDGIKCQYCEYKAARKDSILCHETIHTGVKPFKCNYCEYTSVRKCLLNIHVKKYHSDIKKDVTVVSESKIQSLKLPVENIKELQQLDL